MDDTMLPMSCSSVLFCWTGRIKRKIAKFGNRAIYSVTEKEPEVAYVKGGLFAKGVGLPKPAVETFWRRAEKWEVPVEGAQVVE